MAKVKTLKKANAGPVIELAINEHDGVPFKSFAQSLMIDGEPVECHLRQPGNEPALQIKGKWYVVKFKDVAHALLEHIRHQEKGVE